MSGFQDAVPLKIVLIGDIGVGKTSLLNQFVNETFDGSYKATIGVELATKQLLVDGRTCLLQIWDTAGQERFRSMTAAYYRGANCCVFVFDCTREDTWKSVDHWRQESLDYAEEETFPFVIAGNKIDLGCNVQKDVVEHFGTSRNFPVVFVSAKSSDGVNDLFSTVAHRALSHLEARKQHQMESRRNDANIVNLPAPSSRPQGHDDDLCCI